MSAPRSLSVALGTLRRRVWAEFLAQLSPGRFLRQALTLAGGTALAQALTLLVAPIITRLYSPEDYGLAAIYTAMTAILATAAAGRYELSITAADNDHHAAALLYLSLFCAAAFSTILVPLLIFAAIQLFPGLLPPSAKQVLFLIILNVLLSATYLTLYYWLNRGAHYKQMAHSRIVQVSVASLVSIGLGFLNFGFLGLLIGILLGQFTAILFVLWHVRTLPSRPWLPNLRDLLQIAREYVGNPKYILPAHLIGTAAIQIPSLMLNSLFGPTVAGHYALAQRVVGLPTSLVAAALGDVFRQKAAKAYHETGSFRSLFLRTLLLSAGLAVLPYAALALVAPIAFPLVFSSEWKTAGLFTQILCLSGFFQFALTPVGTWAMIVRAESYILFWHILRLLGVLGLWAFASFAALGPNQVLLGLAAVSIFMYCLDAVVAHPRTRNPTRVQT